MTEYRFKALTVPAYFDEDTVHDSREIEFSIFDIRDSKDEIFFVEIIYGQTAYLCGCYKETLELVSPELVPRDRLRFPR